MTKLTLPKCLSGSNIKKGSTVTSSPDLWLRGQRSKRSNHKNMKWQRNTVNVFILVKHQKVSTVTFLNLPIIKGSNVKKGHISSNLKCPKWYCQCIYLGHFFLTIGFFSHTLNRISNKLNLAWGITITEYLLYVTSGVI